MPHVNRHPVNNLTSIFDALRTGKPTTIVTVAGVKLNEDIQSIAREGGKHYWIIQTSTAKVCVKAA